MVTRWRDELAQARARVRADFQGVIDHIKTQVGPGLEYENGLLRVVLSERGCYYQFLELPEEFSGVIGSAYRHEFIGSAAAHELVETIQQLLREHTPDNTSELSLLMIYEPEAIAPEEGAYVHQYLAQDGGQARQAGHLRPGELPVFIKLKADSDLVRPLLGAAKGVLFFVANLTDRHLLVRIPQAGGGATDLGALPAHLILN